MSSTEMLPELENQSRTGRAEQPGICSADVFDFKSGKPTLLALAEMPVPPAVARNTALEVAEPQEQKPALSERMETFVDRTSTLIAEKLDQDLPPGAFTARRNEVAPLVIAAQREIIKQDPDNAANTVAELLRRINTKDKKGIGIDLALKMDANQMPKSMLVVPAEWTNRALSIVKSSMTIRTMLHSSNISKPEKSAKRRSITIYTSS